MNYRKIFWGSFLFLLGVSFILRQTGIWFFHIHFLFHLWPLLLIYWGITMLPVSDRLKLVLSLTALVLGFVFIFYFSRIHGNFFCPNRENEEIEIDI